MSTPVFPNELVDMIIDNAVDDLDLLASCALVCRAWVPRSRRHLFRSLLVTSENAKQLLELAKSPYASIFNHIYYFHFFDTCEGVESYPWNHFVYRLHELKLSTARALHLSLFNWNNKFSPWIVLSFPRITNLELHNIHAMTFLDSVKFLSKFPQLRQLSLTKIHFISLAWDPGVSANGDNRISPILTSLSIELEDVYLQAMCYWVLLSPVNIGQLKVARVEKRQIRDLLYFMQHVGVTLHTLDISFEDQTQLYHSGAVQCFVSTGDELTSLRRF